MDTIRIYGHKVREWKGADGMLEQIEITYTDYRRDGKVAGIGTEDFSMPRWRGVGRKTVHVWGGRFRKDGSKAWEYHGQVVYRRGASYRDIIRVLEGRYPEALEIELRCC